MAVYFFDSSALVKRYVSETGSKWVHSLFDPALSNRLVIATITAVEIVAAISRKLRLGGISSADAIRGIGLFRSEMAIEFERIDVTPMVIREAMDLAEKHTLRGYDAIQLTIARITEASARRAGASAVLVSADIDLNSAASADGLVVEDPNRHP